MFQQRVRLVVTTVALAVITSLVFAPTARAADDMHSMSGMCADCAADHASLAAAQNFIATFGTGDMDKLFTLVADDIHWEFWGSPDRIALHGPRDGKAALKEWFAAANATFKDEDFGVDEWYADHDTVVLVGHEKGTAIKTGKPVSERWIGIMKFRDGKLASFRGLDDSAQELWATTP